MRNLQTRAPGRQAARADPPRQQRHGSADPPARARRGGAALPETGTEHAAMASTANPTNDPYDHRMAGTVEGQNAWPAMR